jgi:hypothetical protein
MRFHCETTEAATEGCRGCFVMESHSESGLVFEAEDWDLGKPA